MEPHDFDPTVQQVQNAESADMLVYNGGGLEGPWIKKLMQNLQSTVVKA